MVARYFYEQLIYYGFLKSSTQNVKKNSQVKGLRAHEETHTKIFLFLFSCFCRGLKRGKMKAAL